MTTQELLPVMAELCDEFLQEDFTGVCTRKEEQQISLGSKLAQVVIGIRRSGKSTLCRKVLRESGVRAAYINFDDERLKGLQREHLNNVLEAAYMVYGEFEFLLLDEVQNVDGWPLFVNRLIRQNIHLTVTGSNAKLLSNELTTHLTGRHHKIELYLFSFGEYATFKQRHNISDDQGTGIDEKQLERLSNAGRISRTLYRKKLSRLCNGIDGCYHKARYNKAFQHVLSRILQRLATCLMDNFTQEYSATTLAKMFGVSDHTLDTYCKYLQEAFLLLSVHKFSYKSHNRLRGEKLYVVDTVFISNRQNIFSTQNMGWRLENVVFVELLRRAIKQYADVFYYQDRSFEVDFLVTKGGIVEELYQVCYDRTNV